MTVSLARSVIIFDLDGTLVDSAPDLTCALNHVLTLEGMEEISPALVRPFVGHGAVALMQKGYAHHGRPYPDGATAERIKATFMEFYTDHIADESKPFDGVAECLGHLGDAGAALAVCTNKMEALAFPLLKELELEAPFELIFGRDTLSEFKPSGVPLLEIMHRTGREQAVMVGDTETDRNAARNAKTSFAYASFGYGELETPLNQNEQCFDHFEALPRIITELISKTDHGTKPVRD